MKYKIVFLISVLALLSFFSIELVSFPESNQLHTELEIEVSEEIDITDEVLHANLDIAQSLHLSHIPSFVKIQQSKFLEYDIFKPPKIILS